jgi:hypothetical protein
MTDTGPAEAQAQTEQGVDSADTPLAQPTEVQATRARIQGNGVGQREINAQRDPTGTISQDQFSTTDKPSQG